MNSWNHWQTARLPGPSPNGRSPVAGRCWRISSCAPAPTKTRLSRFTVRRRQPSRPLPGRRLPRPLIIYAWARLSGARQTCCGSLASSLRPSPFTTKPSACSSESHAAGGGSPEIRNELALAADARGLVCHELGEIKTATQNFRRSLELLTGLVGAFPTVLRYRESLAKACNSLGVLEQDMGDLAASEMHFRQELPLVERFAQDFPDRPEHARELARTLYNLGIVLTAQNRHVAAEPVFRRAIEITAPIAAKHPDDVQIRFDLAKCHYNFGELLLDKGDAKQALTSLQKAREINEALVKGSPNMPRYASLLAANLVSLGFAQERVEQPHAQETYRAALAIYQRLVTAYPENVDYRIRQAKCVRNLGPILAAVGHVDQAEKLYQRALTALEVKDGQVQTPQWLSVRASVLNNLGQMQSETGRPESAAKPARRSVDFRGPP